MKRLGLAIAIWILAVPALAVQPDEVLDDPVLEERARDISAGLRCPVCRSENIDESDAPISRDLRLLVRERLVAGDSNEEAVEFIVARYGEYVLLNPTTRGSNLLLWLAAPIMLCFAAGVGLGYVRSRSQAAALAEDGVESPALSDEEEARLREILKDESKT
ncbi:MAG: cytochrome c-type biogenesis protein [Pseudomonadota bacterium]